VTPAVWVKLIAKAVVKMPDMNEKMLLFTLFGFSVADLNFQNKSDPADPASPQVSQSPLPSIGGHVRHELQLAVNRWAKKSEFTFQWSKWVEKEDQHEAGTQRDLLVSACDRLQLTVPPEWLGEVSAAGLHKRDALARLEEVGEILADPDGRASGRLASLSEELLPGLGTKERRTKTVDHGQTTLWSSHDIVPHSHPEIKGTVVDTGGDSLRIELRGLGAKDIWEKGQTLPAAEALRIAARNIEAKGVLLKRRPDGQLTAYSKRLRNLGEEGQLVHAAAALQKAAGIEARRKARDQHFRYVATPIAPGAAPGECASDRAKRNDRARVADMKARAEHFRYVGMKPRRLKEAAAGGDPRAVEEAARRTRVALAEHVNLVVGVGQTPHFSLTLFCTVKTRFD
jgi:hypothetical protein